eukprot:TRINITY_DN320_c0_g1_i1.p1 TRINITY_DN320_c0_g1~~TRINITY_DN320_c0_g1_i1.p1  ORF type:complete len:994 (-),score=220.48 TRINITY_DN320_c0_g1_i1:101-2641(-)
MEKHDIGCRDSLRYIAHAAILERSGLYDKARLVFEEGFNMNAEPRDRLNRYYQDFLQRMKQRIERDARRAMAKMGKEPSVATSAGPLMHRDVPSARSTAAVPSNTATTTTAPRSSAPSSFGAAKAAFAAKPAPASNAIAFSIFQDDAPQATTAAQARASRAENPVYPVFVGEDTRKKENSAAATAWTEASVPQKKSLLTTSLNPKAPFTIFDEAIETPVLPTVAQPQAPALNPRAPIAAARPFEIASDEPVKPPAIAEKKPAAFAILQDEPAVTSKPKVFKEPAPKLQPAKPAAGFAIFDENATAKKTPMSAKPPHAFAVFQDSTPVASKPAPAVLPMRSAMLHAASPTINTKNAESFLNDVFASDLSLNASDKSLSLSPTERFVMQSSMLSTAARVPTAAVPSSVGINRSQPAMTPLTAVKTMSSFSFTPKTGGFTPKTAPKTGGFTPKTGGLSALSFTSPAATNAADDMFDFEDDITLSGSEPTLHAPHAVDPFEKSQRDACLTKIRSQLSACNGYFENTALTQPDIGRKGDMVTIESGRFFVKKSLGSGGYAQVFLVECEDARGVLYAMKSEQPASAWEYMMLQQVEHRVPAAQSCYVVRAHELHMYKNRSVMLLEYSPYGTLQNAINVHMQSHKPMDELLAMFYTVELLKVLESLHKVGIIHGDVKPDNLLIRNDDCDDELGEWQADGSDGWYSKGLKIADFGRSIDTRLYTPKTCFFGESSEALKCIEMRTGRPWTYQIDTFGLCDTVYALLHGKYLDVVQQHGSMPSQNHWKPQLPFKRYWQAHLWENLFDTLLNIPSCEQNPDLTQLRRPFEAHLSTRARDLRLLLLQEYNLLAAAASK